MSVKTIKKIILKKDRTFPTIHNIHGYNVILIDIPSSELVYIQSYVNVGFLFETKTRPNPGPQKVPHAGPANRQEKGAVELIWVPPNWTR